MTGTAAHANDARSKRLRNRLRARGEPCHLCGGEILYDAHHLDPMSFQMDHRWQIALGGPEHDEANVAASHRACNRARSATIDDISVLAAAESVDPWGVTPRNQDQRAGTHRACQSVKNSDLPAAGISHAEGGSERAC